MNRHWRENSSRRYSKNYGWVDKTQDGSLIVYVTPFATDIVLINESNKGMNYGAGFMYLSNIFDWIGMNWWDSDRKEIQYS